MFEIEFKDNDAEYQIKTICNNVISTKNLKKN